jgi:hypothetical protein
MRLHLGRLSQAKVERRLAAPGGIAGPGGGWPRIPGGSGAVIERPRRNDLQAVEQRVSEGARRRRSAAAGELRWRRETMYGAGGGRANPIAPRRAITNSRCGLVARITFCFFFLFLPPPSSGILLLFKANEGARFGTVSLGSGEAREALQNRPVSGFWKYTALGLRGRNKLGHSCRFLLGFSGLGPRSHARSPKEVGLRLMHEHVVLGVRGHGCMDACRFSNLHARGRPRLSWCWHVVAPEAAVGRCRFA